MAEVGTRAGYPQVTIPAGYDPAARRPQAISFTGTAGDDAKLLGFGYASSGRRWCAGPRPR